MRLDNAMLGNSAYERSERDFYPTPTNVTMALINHIKDITLSSNSVIWEPACGDGKMVKVLEQHFRKVLASDIVPLNGAGETGNFLTTTPKEQFDAIITNPPFGDAIDSFIARGLKHLRDKRCQMVALLGRMEIDAAVTRAPFFEDCPEFHSKLQLLWRPRWVEGSTGSPRHNYAWYIWRRHNSFVGKPQLSYARKG